MRSMTAQGARRFPRGALPDEQFRHDRREIDAFFGEPVIHLPPVRFFRFGGKIPAAELPETVRQNIGGDAFAGFLELFERVISPDHQVTDDQESDQRSPNASRDMLTRATGAR